MTPIPVAAALSQFDPTCAAIWAFTTTFLNQMTEDEREVFVNELSKREIKEELFGSIEFARASKATIEAAANTASEEKIRMLAGLLRRGTNEGLISDFDVYKEYTKIVDDISPREFLILALMDQSTTQFSSPEYSGHTSIDDMSVWQKTKEVLLNDLGLCDEELQSFMNRVARTGCVNFDIISTTPGRSGARVPYSLSPLYFELKKYIMEDSST